MAEENQAAAAAATTTTTETSLLDDILHETQLKPQDEGYDVVFKDDDLMVRRLRREPSRTMGSKIELCH